jgi:hypothetical protein
VEWASSLGKLFTGVSFDDTGASGERNDKGLAAYF